MAEAIDPTRVLKIVADVAREARPHIDAYIALDASLERELGLDSLARVELVLRLEREFGVSLPEQALASSETPRDLLRFLLGTQGQAPQVADRTVASLAETAEMREGARPPQHAQTLTEALEYHVERQPDRLTVFLYEDKNEVEITYRMLWDGALAYAAGLAAAGLTPG
ncbi:MAG TPA: acyl carrier protein, partial [Burkholderiales bacterium]|nr:acyl carrier protein [Burkholderiales bacterium]